MCGIVSYIGERKALPILLEGLSRLEYRGYDSAGIFICTANENQLIKVAGKVKTLQDAFDLQPDIQANVGIGHTRWATHGQPNKVNAHPHVSNNGRLVMVHNGIIENYEALKSVLSSKGYTFNSDTDTEVLVNLIEDIQNEKKVPLEDAVQAALGQVVGAYGIVLFDQKDPDTLISARLGSPLVIGLGEKEFFVTSDATPFIEYTKEAIYLKEYEMAVIKKNQPIKIRDIKNDLNVDPYVEELQWNLEHIQKGGYDHFMLKEIYEQPDALRNTLRGRINLKNKSVQINGINAFEDKFLNAKRIIIVGCGTSWHAGLVGEYLIESLARLPIEVEYASEFRYRNPIIDQYDIVIPISQSGETADTLAAMKIAREKGAFIFGISNVVGASIPRETDSGIYSHAGPEVGVASTKSFTTQVGVLMLLAIRIAQLKKRITPSESYTLLKELEEIPDLLQNFLNNSASIKPIAEAYYKVSNCLYLGRGLNFPVALEGALKLKEISYIHAEGYPAAEMKHGPIALIDENMPVVVIATKKVNYDKIVSNIQEIKSRKGKIIAIVTSGDLSVRELADHVIEIPDCSNYFTPLFAVIPLQLLSYHIAVMRGCNVDQPRNLAKSVTVE
ncbi:MAG: glutamine--fructose-6-phosphate transaminase (isomerizing) [Flavobacteriaceae bacterium]|nr:glutamine--fructose-6-phosphate transaminase (isomerizing) [Flavobacteriaceae bacterium]